MTDFGWERSYPMKKKSDAHEALSLLFQQMGVPDKIIVGGSKEQVLVNFQRKYLESGCRLKGTEMYSPC